jgi:hypothetical protein
MRKSLSVREERLQGIVFMNSPLATELARKCLAHCCGEGGLRGSRRSDAPKPARAKAVHGRCSTVRWWPGSKTGR